MFWDFSSEVIQFPSSWQTEKKRESSSTQTGPIRRNEIETQTKKSRHAECQTVPLLELMQESLSLDNSKKNHEKGLVKFLASAEPLIIKQLEVNIAAAKFYGNVFKQRQREEEVEISCSYMLDEDAVTSNQETNCIEVTCVAWSSSGATIAVAYGTNENIAWSDNRSYLCLWNLDRPRLNRHAADQKLELDSSIQVAAFHPQFPGYIAAGLFSGSVLIWDLAKDDVVYSSTSHDDPVTCLCWLEDKNPKYLRLLSASSDGRLSVWKHRKIKDVIPIKIEKYFKIRASNLARRAGIRGATTIGVTCLAVASEHVRDKYLTDGGFSTSSTLLVGSEIGALMKCNLDIDDSNPVIFTYESHVGPVYTVDWSPFHRHLFLTCSTDQTCRVYHSLHATALRDIRPDEAAGGREANYLFAARWSPSRPRIFFTAGTRGRIEACDAITSRSMSSCDASDREGKSCIINDLQFNPIRRNTFATGSGSGLAHVWQVGSLLNESEDLAEEIAQIGELADEALTHD